MSSRHLNNLCFHGIRVIDLGVEIQRHFGGGSIKILWSTIRFLHELGFRKSENATVPTYKLYYSDLKYCAQVKWMHDLQIQRRKQSNTRILSLCQRCGIDQNGSVSRRAMKIFDTYDLTDSRGHICLNQSGQLLLNEIDAIYLQKQQADSKLRAHAFADRNEILIVGYLNRLSSSLHNDALTRIPSVVYKQCCKYYHQSHDIHQNKRYLSYVSVSENAFKLKIYDTKHDKVHRVKLTNINVDNESNINQQSILYMVRNTSLPKWIRTQYDSIQCNVKDFSIQKRDHKLSLLFIKSMDFDNYVIIVDEHYRNGYTFQIPSETEIVYEMYSYSNGNNTILCIDDENELCDYDIDRDAYNKFDIVSKQRSYTHSMHSERGNMANSIGCGLVAFDDNTKFLKCGGLDMRKSHHNEQEKGAFGRKYVSYAYYNNAEVVQLNHETLKGEYMQSEIASLNIGKAHFSMLYIDKLQQIVAGPGGDKHSVSASVVETYDVFKNRWSLIDAKTNHCYNSVVSLNEKNKNVNRSCLWTDYDNPFVVNLCDGFTFAEFIDLREQKRWNVNNKLTKHLKSWQRPQVGLMLI